MLSVSRSLARQLRAVIRRAGIGKTPATSEVLFRAGKNGLQIRAVSPRVAIEYHVAGQFSETSFTVPLAALAKVEGKREEPIEFAILPENQVALNWVEARVPKRELCQSQLERIIVLPEPPEIFAENGPGLLAALADATDAAEKDATRYATNCLRLSGPRESIAATDGHQLLVQGRFHFPWTDDLLIPANRVFSSGELPQNQPVNVGYTDEWVLFRAGHWTLWLNIQKSGRFPRVEDLIQRPEAANTTLSIDDVDKKFLIDTLPQLPADDSFHQPVTIDLNGHVGIRAKPADKDTTTELVLANSRYTGEPIRINTNREFLRRAMRLGFSTLHFYSPTQPIQCHDENRSFIWSSLDASGAFAPSADGVRIESSGVATAVIPPLPPQPRNRLEMIATSKTIPSEDAKPTRRAEPASSTEAPSSANPLESAIALRDSLRDTLDKTNELIRALKRQRQQSRLVQTTLNSLRQLQTVAK